ncbi:MAG: hypothetical protein AB7T48_07825 [Solirubrobacterales bacterium]
MPSTARTAAFVVVSAALIALALIFAPAGPDSAPAPASSARPALASPNSGLIARAGRRQTQLHKAATAFIAAYLRYEVGDLPPSVARSLGRLATDGFGRQLLGDPPRPGGPVGAARIVEVESGFLDRDVDRALVRGAARRPDGPEELSFVFVLREGRWLAAGAAE